ncbi:two-component system response regulator [Marivirga tractuosa]|uniref:Response regulator receiver protein n=1 Tax=Marivirga tractuosa (strain ATCC 23168 / DSM 4126 / NBRC 15989 / NCIMB 1408 / VKM B-1430 / H-43) TaxID=643867 RepID=E4TKU9_MARTH|nr:response regulator [Marivirga tractuosa]ADR22252.1 response regulator receiver protein [Marivirga tractuosa DSM 4126]BDD13282.1 two-component system response regulator [Marivirga tractuosa]
MMKPKRIHILLVEDNEGDIVLTQEALEENKFINTVDVARNGREALDYLMKNEGYEDAIQPDLILLDINLPIMSGHEVLSEIKNNEELKQIPVIMLTTSSAATDINKAYNNHANCFISKPVEINEFMEAISGIEQFWFSIVSLPRVKK